MSWPPELEALVETVAAEQAPDPDQLAAIARWRLGCGDGRSAARWHRWSLQPPAPARLRSELEPLLLLLNSPQLAARLGQQQGWGAVLLAPDSGDPKPARRSQQAAHPKEPPTHASPYLPLATPWACLGVGGGRGVSGCSRECRVVAGAEQAGDHEICTGTKVW